MYFQQIMNMFGLKFSCSFKTSSKQVVDLEAVVTDLYGNIQSLHESLNLVVQREEESKKNANVLISAILATYGGEVKLDANVIDVVSNNANLLVHIEQPEADGSRVVRLIEKEPSPDEKEPTEEELLEVEEEFIDELYPEYDDEDDDGDCEDLVAG